ncbi:MAG: DUF302 domain-containing protein [Abditibacteriaceae bacterium]
MKIIQSEFSAQETGDRLVEKIGDEGWHVFAIIDHAKQAQDKGLDLRPTQVVLFGNPHIGTLLMQDQQTSAIDLPAKVLIWEDENADVLIAYNTSDWLKERHQLTDDATVQKIGEVLESVCQFAAKA